MAWLALAVGGMGGFVWNVVAISVAQAITPPRLLGRLNSAANTVSWGVIPIGAALGGLLARADLRLPYFISAALLLVATLLAVRMAALLPQEGESGEAPTTPS
ncbi:MAG: hypothetical protein LC808_01310 [Actinobacteria bacterium]|nr:hypothetical protein [Actinomycetota bacterium]